MAMKAFESSDRFVRLDLLIYMSKSFQNLTASCQLVLIDFIAKYRTVQAEWMEFVWRKRLNKSIGRTVFNEARRELVRAGFLRELHDRNGTKAYYAECDDWRHASAEDRAGIRHGSDLENGTNHTGIQHGSGSRNGIIDAVNLVLDRHAPCRKTARSVPENGTLPGRKTTRTVPENDTHRAGKRHASYPIDVDEDPPSPPSGVLGASSPGPLGGEGGGPQALAIWMRDPSHDAAECNRQLTGPIGGHDSR